MFKQGHPSHLVSVKKWKLLIIQGIKKLFLARSVFALVSPMKIVIPGGSKRF